ncbi:MAG: hypothetical protein ABSA58_08695 [Acetobacteraceae bacterium]|jgi:hypothetical protein
MSTSVFQGMSDEELDLIEARIREATAGPWASFVEGRDHTSGSSFIRTPGSDIELSGATASDQDFIAHAREDVPKLLREVRRLRRRAAR